MFGQHSSMKSGTMVLFVVTCFVLPQIAHAAETVVHSNQPLLPTRTVELEEIWRVGGNNSDLMFGLMVNATTDTEGRVYLMDQQLNTVTVVSPTGEVLRQIFREGDGPGEIRTPQGIALLSDGRVALAQQFPGKFIMVDSIGDPAGVITVIGGKTANEGFTALAGCSARNGNLVVSGMFQLPADNKQSRTSYVASINPVDGTEVLRYRVHDTVLDFGKAVLIEREMVAPCYTHAQGPDGRMYFARDWREYAIEVLSPDGTLEKVITRNFEPRQRTQQEKDRINELFEVQAAQMPFPITWEIEPTEQYIGGMHVDTSGTLWVSNNQSESNLPPGIFTSYDTYDTTGHWKQAVHIACEGDPAYDGLIFLNDDRVLLVKGLVLAGLTATGSQGAVFDEEGGQDEMEVICCRLKQRD
jgi:hypothetical protein